MDNIFDGKPSFELSHRPFFSIVVACYNSSKYLDTLLTSIVNQDLRDDIELILADDHSTEPYDDIVDKYKDKICIKRVITDYNFAPGNTREKGCSVATGEWLCIADHDDKFLKGSLPKIKNLIIEKKEKYLCISDFVEALPEYDPKNPGGILRRFHNNLNWNHGKFYNLDNLWRAFDIHYKKDFKSHEDIYISSCINCCMKSLGLQPLFTDIPTYVWFAHKESISRSKYVIEAKGRSFLETLFEDYITSTAGVYFDFYIRGVIKKEYAMNACMDIIAYCYFYLSSFIFRDPDGWIKVNYEYCRELVRKTKFLFNLTNSDIWQYYAANNAAQYKAVEKSAAIAAGPYIPFFTIGDFLIDLSPDDENARPSLNVSLENPSKNINIRDKIQ